MFYIYTRNQIVKLFPAPHSTSRCLNRSQVEEVIFKTSKDLKLKYHLNLWIPEEDLAFGIELYSILKPLAFFF